MNIRETFYQIQKIIIKIAEDENLKKQFLSLESTDDKFDFLVETGKDLSIRTNFSHEDFEKFDAIFSTVNKISQDEDKSFQFSKLSNSEQVYKFIKEEMDKNSQIDITQSDIEAFSSSLVESVSGDDLDSVAGGLPDPTSLTHRYRTFCDLLELGNKLGSIWGKFFTKVKEIGKENESSK